MFAGIGAGDLGFEQAGIELVAHVEKDATCCKVLNSHWERVLCYQDVRYVLPGLLPGADVYLVTDPCQSNTQLGQSSLGKKRPSLWREALRIIQDRRPQFVVRENPTRTHKLAPSPAELVAHQLEEIGYVCTIIDVQGGEVCGVSRFRTFVCAGLGAAGGRLAAVLSDHRCDKDAWPKHWTPQMPHPALTTAHNRFRDSNTVILEADGRCRVLSGVERLRAQGLPDTWLDCLGQIGLDTSSRLTGNALPVYVAKWIGERIRDAA